MKDMQKTQIKLLEMKTTICEMKITMDGINRLHVTKTNKENRRNCDLKETEVKTL